MEHNFTLEELNAKWLEIEAQIEAVRLSQKVKAIEQIKAIVVANAITRADLAFIVDPVSDKKPRKVRPEVLPKYRGPNGELWNGLGRKPNWLTAAIDGGATLEQFAV